MIVLILGLFITILGASNLRGNLSSIHWYNRRRVTAEDAPKYGKLVGAGTILIGLSLILSSVLEALFKQEFFQLFTLIGLFAGLPLIFFAQFKYNKGLF